MQPATNFFHYLSNFCINTFTDCFDFKINFFYLLKLHGERKAQITLNRITMSVQLRVLATTIMLHTKLSYKNKTPHTVTLLPVKCLKCLLYYFVVQPQLYLWFIKNFLDPLSPCLFSQHHFQFVIEIEATVSTAKTTKI